MTLRNWLAQHWSRRGCRPARRRQGPAVRLLIEVLEDRTLFDRALMPMLSVLPSASGPESLVAPRLAVALNVPATQTVSVHYAVTSGMAKNGVDYTLKPGTLTFAPGDRVKDIPLTVVDHGVNVADKTVVISLSGAQNAFLGGATLTYTILNDVPPLTVSFAGGNPTSGAEGQSAAFTVNLSAVSGQPVTLKYAATGGSATAGVDYKALSGTLTIPAGKTSGTITLSTIDDRVFEGDETVQLSLTGATGAALGATGTSLTYTIQDNGDAPPAVSFKKASASGPEGQTVTIPVALSAPAGKPVTVQLVTGGTAQAGVDYTLAGGQVTFAPGQSVAAVTLDVLDTAQVGPDKTVVLTLAGPDNATLATKNITFTDIITEGKPVVRFATASSSGPETQDGSLPVVLNTAGTMPITVHYAAGGGTARNGVDYTLKPGTLTFQPGQTTASIPFTVVNHTTNQADKTLVVSLTGPKGAALGAATAIYTILNDVPPPTVSFAANNPTSGAEGKSVTFTVGLSAASGQAVTVGYAAAGGTATSGADYRPLAGTVTFKPGQTSKTITLATTDDRRFEGDETVQLSLTNPGNATLGTTPSLTYTIQDNGDAPPAVSFKQTKASGPEGQAVSIQVALSQPAGKPVTVQLQAGGTAQAGVDYTLAGGQVTFAPGQTVAAVTLDVLDTARVGPDKTVMLTLASPDNATLATRNITFTDTIIETSPGLGFDVTPPVITLQNAPATTVSHNASLTGQVTDDFSGVASLQAAVDDGTFAAVTLDAAGNFTFTTALALTGSADGSHTVHLLAADVAGNKQSLDVPFTLDTQAPTIRITSPVPNLLTNTNVTVTGQVADDGGSGDVAMLQAAIDNGTFTAVAFDSAGNFSFFAPNNTKVRIQAYNSFANAVADISLNTGTGVAPVSTNEITWKSTAGLPDSDDDGLVDVAESIIGTDPKKFSTVGDGISDGIKIAMGLDPLAGRGFPTGRLASLPLQGEAKEVAAVGSALDPQGQTAYVATGSYGLAIVNASQFQKPIVLGQIDLPGDATDVSVDPSLNIAAVATNAGGLQFVDVSGPASPRLLQTVNVAASQVEVVNGVAYVTVGATLQAFDLLTGENRQTLPLAGSTLIGLAREGTMLYTQDSNHRLQAIDISGSLMVARGSLNLPAGGGKLFVGNGIAYVGAGDGGNNGGFVTADVSDPNNLKLLSGVDAANIEGQSLAANGSGLVVTTGTVQVFGQGLVSALDVVNSSDPTNTGAFLTRINLPAAPYGVTVAAGIAFVADGTGGLQVVNYEPFDNRGQPPTITINTTALDVDPATAGIQVVEGTTLPVRATVQDDVQVRNVELLVNGQVVSNDVSFPFDLSVIAPAITPDVNTVTVQVRATDTGGNVSLSNVLTFNLVRDTIPPTILSMDPLDGSTRREGLQQVQVTFSEPLADATVNASTFQLEDGTGQVLPVRAVQLQGGGRIVTVTVDPLSAGSYQLVVVAPMVTDRAGNALGTTNVVSHFSVVPATIAWINPAGGNWDDPTNWDAGRLPGASDDVLIGVPGDVTVTFRQGSSTIRSLLSSKAFTLSGGTLTVTNTMEVDNSFLLSGGTLSSATVLRGKAGQGITVSTTAGTLSGVTLDADLDLTQANGVAVGVSNGLTLNGTATLGSGSNYGYLQFTGTQTLGGTGTVLFDSTNGATGLLVGSYNTTLTIGPGVTVRGNSGFIGWVPAYTAYDNRVSVVNQGTVRADSAGGTVTLRADNGWTNAGTVEAKAGTIALAGTYTQTAGSTILSGGTISGSLLDIQGGSLSGTGTVNASVRNAGVLSPGGAGAGRLTISGNYTQLTTGVLDIDLGGLTAGSQYDQLVVTGSTTLDGTLNIFLIDGFVPAPGDSFKVLAFASRAATFATINGLDLGNGRSLVDVYNTTDFTLTAS